MHGVGYGIPFYAGRQRPTSDSRIAMGTHNAQIASNCVKASIWAQGLLRDTGVPGAGCPGAGCLGPGAGRIAGIIFCMVRYTLGIPTLNRKSPRAGEGPFASGGIPGAGRVPGAQVPVAGCRVLGARVPGAGGPGAGCQVPGAQVPGAGRIGRKKLKGLLSLVGLAH